ncbi:MAG: Fe-S-binding domain-containing protein, partial [Bryobacteraceae bacterium]
MNLLDLVLFLPLIGFLAILILPKDSSRMTAMLLSLAIFVISLGLLSPYLGSETPTGYQFVSNISWIESPAIRYHIGMDGLTLWLVLLSTLLTPIAVLISWKYIDHRIKEYFAFLMLLEFGVIGVFVSLDLFLFYVFWEVSLVPMYFLI